MEEIRLTSWYVVYPAGFMHSKVVQDAFHQQQSMDQYTEI